MSLISFKRYNELLDKKLKSKEELYKAIGDQDPVGAIFNKLDQFCEDSDALQTYLIDGEKEGERE